MIPLAISTALFFDWLILVDWDLAYNEYALEKEYVWIETIGVSWHVGMDGLVLPNGMAYNILGSDYNYYNME